MATVKDVRGNQYVGGNQDVGGNQYVGFMKIYLFAKWAIIIDRDTDNISIGCQKKTKSEWVDFFNKKQKINLEPTDRNYLKLESAFKIACEIKNHLILMNDKP